MINVKMASFIKSVCIFVVLSISLINCVGPKQIQLSVYYESNCPDSKEFILEQLHPTMQVLHNYVKLKLVPFGKSQSINYGEKFECQHGPPECLGNMVQDCSLFHLKHLSDLERLNYVVCEMATEAGSMGDLQCVRQTNLSETQIEECVLKGKGRNLQLESEFFTSLIKPSFVPSITINENFDQEIQDNALVDLFGTICSIIPNIPPCARHYNNIALGYIMQKPARPNYV